MIVAFLAAAADPPPALWSAAWWSEFLRSPGFAGSAAVLGAALAFASVLVNNHASRKARERDRWWEMYQRVEGEWETYSDRRATMLVKALGAEAKTYFERQLMAVLVSELLPYDDAEGGDTNG